MDKYRADAEGATFTVVQVNNGGYNPSQPETGTSLDVQYIGAMAYPTPQIFYSIGQGRPSGTQDEYILALLRIPFRGNMQCMCATCSHNLVRVA